MNTARELAYAKVNLFLDIVARREDGFHDVSTVMHPISLHDELIIKIKPSKTRSIKMYVQGAVRVPVDSRNLAYRAVELYMSYLGVYGAVEIQLEKNIPVAAGLAGGSADAAAALRAMNRLYKKALSQRILLNLAETLGSDVPFCLLMQTAMCQGRGEVMTPVVVNRTLHFVIAIANEYVSTPKAYEALDKLYSDFDGSVPFGKGDIVPSLLNFLYYPTANYPLTLYNIFEDAVLPICEGAKKIREALGALSPMGVLMSGSGPSVYAIFEDEFQAKEAVEQINKMGYHAYYATSKE